MPHGKALDEELTRAVQEASPVSEVILRLLEIETNTLIERRIGEKDTPVSPPERKLLADFDFAFQKGVDKSQILELATLSFIPRKQGLILAGSSGTGKSHLAKALLLLGCQKLYSCRYTTAAAMLTRPLLPLVTTRWSASSKPTPGRKSFIDEVGFDRLEQESSRNASLFFKVIDARYCKSSTIMTTNIDFKELGDYLGDPGDHHGHGRPHGPSCHHHPYRRPQLPDARIQKAQPFLQATGTTP